MLTRLDWQRSITSKATLGQETTLALGMRLVPTNCSHLAGSRERPHPREPRNAPNGAQAWEQLTSWDERGLSPKRAKARRGRPRSALPRSHTRKPPEAMVERAKVERRGIRRAHCLPVWDWGIELENFLNLAIKKPSTLWV